MEKKKVLIVEDDAFLLQMYVGKLEPDYEVFHATDGEKAIRQARKNLPNIILLDLLIPKKDGFEVLKQLKKLKTTKDIPVIILTNLSQREDIKKALAAGAEDYLIKAHCLPAEVLNKIKELI